MTLDLQTFVQVPPCFYGKKADPLVTGQLISDLQRRRDWINLVQSLQVASETQGGPLEGWVFHGTDDIAGKSIALEGLHKSAAITSDNGCDWQEAQGVHFATANVAAFFAEDRIESLSSPEIGLVIWGAPLQALSELGALVADGQMLDCPIYSRIKADQQEAHMLWDASPRDWQACLRIFETIVVLGDVPAERLVAFRHMRDVALFLVAPNQATSDSPSGYHRKQAP